jgi:hypothetical protein
MTRRAGEAGRDYARKGGEELKPSRDCLTQLKGEGGERGDHFLTRQIPGEPKQLAWGRIWGGGARNVELGEYVEQDGRQDDVANVYCKVMQVRNIQRTGQGRNGGENRDTAGNLGGRDDRAHQFVVVLGQSQELRCESISRWPACGRQRMLPIGEGDHSRMRQWRRCSDGLMFSEGHGKRVLTLGVSQMKCGDLGAGQSLLCSPKTWDNIPNLHVGGK